MDELAQCRFPWDDLWSGLPPTPRARYLDMKEKDQARALALIDADPQLSALRRLTAPYLDRETRGVPAVGRPAGLGGRPSCGGGSRRSSMLCSLNPPCPAKHNAHVPAV